MLRRLLAAFLAVSIAVPLSAFAGGGCQMDVPMFAAERCDCCTAPMTAGTASCATSATAQAGCGCTLQADSGSQPLPTAPAGPTSVSFAIERTRISAALSTPQPTGRIVALATSPPGAGALVSRPVLCSWTI